MQIIFHMKFVWNKASPKSTGQKVITIFPEELRFERYSPIFRHQHSIMLLDS